MEVGPSGFDDPRLGPKSSLRQRWDGPANYAQRRPARAGLDARVGSHRRAPRLAGLLTAGCRGLNRDGPQGTPPSPPTSPSTSTSPSPASVRVRLADRLGMQRYAGRASPSDVLSRMQPAAHVCGLHVQILEILILILGSDYHLVCASMGVHPRSTPLAHP